MAEQLIELVLCGCGEIGKRIRLKIWRVLALVGSSPTTRTEPISSSDSLMVEQQSYKLY